MDSLDLCLPKALAELNLLEQYKLNTLVHKWRDVVGDVIADHTKIVSIKPPNMVISADNSMWMQEFTDAKTSYHRGYQQVLPPRGNHRYSLHHETSELCESRN